MKTRKKFKRGDYVRFVARHIDDVPYNCTTEMERDLYGKIFLVDAAFDDMDYHDTQRIEVKCCELTDDPDSCDIHWKFSSPMFELYEDPKPVDDGLPKLTFDDFCWEAQNAGG